MAEPWYDMDQELCKRQSRESTEYPTRVVTKSFDPGNMEYKTRVERALRGGKERDAYTQLVSRSGNKQNVFSHICRPLCYCNVHRRLIMEELKNVEWDKDVRMEPLVIKKVVVDVLKAVKCLHDADIAHCDIKPGNIMMREAENSYVLGDFDASCFAMSKEGMDGISLSTDGWSRMKDEKAMGIDSLAKLDLMSIGVLIAKMFVYEDSAFNDEESLGAVESYMKRCLGKFHASDAVDHVVDVAKQLVSVSLGFVSGTMDIDTALAALSVLPCASQQVQSTSESTVARTTEVWCWDVQSGVCGCQAR